MDVRNRKMDLRKIQALLKGIDISKVPTMNVDRVVLYNAQSTQETHEKVMKSSGESSITDKDKNKGNVPVRETSLDQEHTSLNLDKQKIELKGKQILFSQGAKNDLLVYMTSEQEPSAQHTLSQPTSEDSDYVQTKMQYELKNPGVNGEGMQDIESKVLLGSFNKATVYIDGARIGHSSEVSPYDVSGDEEMTKMIFIPFMYGNDSDNMDVSDDELPAPIRIELYRTEDIECARKVSEESVIASQTHTHCFSSKGNGVKVGIVNKEDGGNSPHEDHMASEIEGSPVIAEDISSMFMSPHNIKHAASELHPPSLTVCWRNTQEDTSERENDQSDTVLAASTNVISIGCSSLKEFLDSKFYSIPLLRESCNSNKSSTNVSDEYYNTNTQATVTVEETNKSINFSPQFSSGENTINFNDSHNYKFRSISLDPESSNHCVTIMDADSGGTCIRKKKVSDAFRNKEILIGEFSNEPYSLKPFSIGNLQDQARTDKTNLTDEDEHVNLMSCCSTNKVKTQNTPIGKVISLRSESSDNLVKSVDAKDSVSTYNVNTDGRIRKICDDFLNMVAYENTVKPPQRTCEAKMRSLKSSDDFSDIEQYSNPKTFCVNKEHENFITDEYDLPDEDGYVNLIPSCVLIGSKSQSVPVEERIISLEPESSSKAQSIPEEERTVSLEPESTEILDLVAVAKDSMNYCCNTIFTETFCKSTKTERPENNVPKSSSYDVAKVKALRKRVQKVSSVYRKRVSNKRKVGRIVKKSLQNSGNSPVSIVRRKCQQSKYIKKSESILHSISSPVRGKNCNIKFLDSSTKNCCDIDEQNTLTSTQGSIVEYACDNCNFASRIVNNLIIHRKYCKIKSTVDMLDSEGENIEDYESSYDTIDNIILDTEKKNLEVLLHEMKSGSPIYFRFPVRRSTSRIPEK